MKRFLLVAGLVLAGTGVWADTVPGANNPRNPVGHYPTAIDTSRAMVIRASVEIAAPPQVVAAFLGQMDRYFLKLSPENRKSELLGGGSLVLGAEWLTEQLNDGQLVRSRHKVVEADGASRLTLVSDPSVTVVDDSEHITPTITQFTIAAKADGGSILSERLTVCFSSLFEQLGAEMLGVTDSWQTYTDASLAKMARMIEAETAKAVKPAL